MADRHYPIPEWKKRQVVKLREDARLSQPDIARATGIHVATVSDILRKAGKGGRLKYHEERTEKFHPERRKE